MDNDTCNYIQKHPLETIRLFGGRTNHFDVSLSQTSLEFSNLRIAFSSERINGSRLVPLLARVISRKIASKSLRASKKVPRKSGRNS